MKKFLLILMSVLLLQISAHAATTPPNPQSNPILASIIKSGGKVFFLGYRHGMDGWFIFKDNQVQFAYMTPDNKGLVEGALIDENGQNLTAQQASNLIRDDKEVAQLLQQAQQNSLPAADISGAGALSGVLPGATPSASVGAPPPPSPASIVGDPNSPGERLLKDLGTATPIILGNPGSPEVVMVMDPHCPHCQATWKAMRDEVIKGSLHLRMIPIGTEGTDNERAAAILLSTIAPIQVWDAYVSGDKSQLVGTPSDGALKAVKSNHAIIDRWSIQTTPYLVYRGKDGKIKVLQGEPAKVSTILSDMGIQ